LLSWSGRGESPTLTAAEGDGPPPPALLPEYLLSASYLNELLLKLTVPHDPQRELYLHYEATWRGSARARRSRKVLRHFETRLLQLLGYGNELAFRGGWAPGGGGSVLPFPPRGGGLAGRRGRHGRRRAGPGAAGPGRRTALSDPEGQRQARDVLRAALDLCLDGRELATRAVARAVAKMERSA